MIPKDRYTKPQTPTVVFTGYALESWTIAQTRKALSNIAINEI
jgi:hypothetical protein